MERLAEKKKKKRRKKNANSRSKLTANERAEELEGEGQFYQWLTDEILNTDHKVHRESVADKQVQGLRQKSLR